MHILIYIYLNFKTIFYKKKEYFIIIGAQCSILVDDEDHWTAYKSKYKLAQAKLKKVALSAKWEN